MICRPTDPSTVPAPTENHTWTNWDERVTRTLERWELPEKLTDLVEIVAQATEDGAELHAVGSGWAFEDVAASERRMVSTAGLNKRIPYVVDGVDPALNDDWRALQSNPQSTRKLVHVEAGITIADFSTMLAADHLAMSTLGGANGQTLAGAVSTSTHGADIDFAPLPDLVRALHIVTTGGNEVWLERESEPITEKDRLLPHLCPDARIIWSDRIFDSAVVSLGRFGVIYSMVLEVCPEFRLAETATKKTNTETVLALLEIGWQAGTFLSPLLPGITDFPPIHPADARGMPRAVELVFNSQKTDTCWIRRRWPTTFPVDMAVNQSQNPLDGASAQVVLTTTAAALEGFAALLSVFLPLEANAAFSRAVRLRAMALDLTVLGGDAIAESVNALWASPRVNVLGHWIGPQLAVSDLVGLAVDGGMASSSTTGRVGRSDLIMSGDPPVSYRAASIEMVFPAESNNFLVFLRNILLLAPTMRQAGYISVRFSAPSSAALSMHNVNTPHAVSIECASLRGLEGNADWMRFVEALGTSLGGRPHWGQTNTLNKSRVTALYGERLFRWREDLAVIAGLSTTFSNAYSRRTGLEPIHIVRRVAAVRRTNGVATHLCGRDEGWGVVEVAEAIAQIESGAVNYVTEVAGDDARINVVRDGARKYLRTSADMSEANNLDALPEC